MILRFGTVGAHLDLDGEVLGSSQGHINDLEIMLTAPQPVLIIMNVCKGKVLAIKRHSSYLKQWTSRQMWYNSKRWLSDKIKRVLDLQIDISI